MLPGFRFLFSAIVLSVSVLVFGCGAASLFRTAHEEFANAPTWRPAPETRFVQADPRAQPAAPPVLAMLRVDDAAQRVSKTESSAASPAAADQSVTAPNEPEKTAALEPTAAVKPDAPVVAAEAAAAAGPAQTPAAQVEAAPAVAGETKTARAEASPALQSDDPSAWPPETFDPPASQADGPEAGAISTRIATLGGPPVTIEPPAAKAVRAKSESNGVSRRVHARRIAAARRRRAAFIRARQAQQASQQEQATPFGLPTARTR